VAEVVGERSQFGRVRFSLRAAVETENDGTGAVVCLERCWPGDVTVVSRKWIRRGAGLGDGDGEEEAR